MNFDYKDTVDMSFSDQIEISEVPVTNNKACYFYMKHNYTNSVKIGDEKFKNCLKSDIGHSGAGIHHGIIPENLQCSITSEYTICFCRENLCNKPENWNKIMSKYMIQHKNSKVMNNREFRFVVNTIPEPITITMLGQESIEYTKCSIKLKSLMKEERFENDEKFNSIPHIITDDLEYDNNIYPLHGVRSKRSEKSKCIGGNCEEKCSNWLLIVGIGCFLLSLVLFPIPIILVHLTCKRLIDTNKLPRTDVDTNTTNLINAIGGDEGGTINDRPKKGQKKKDNGGKKGGKEQKKKDKDQVKTAGEQVSDDARSGEQSSSVTGGGSAATTDTPLEVMLRENMK